MAHAASTVERFKSVLGFFNFYRHRASASAQSHGADSNCIEYRIRADTIATGRTGLNIQQLRAVHEVVRQGIKISSAADALCKAQPGISRQLKEIEDELGAEIFRRSRNRTAGLTPPGR